MSSKQYLIGKEADEQLKTDQADMVKSAHSKNKDLRSQLQNKKEQIREDGLTQAEVVRFGITRSKLLSLVKQGKIKTMSIGSKTLYHRDDVAEYL